MARKVLVLDEQLMAELKALAAARDKSLSILVDQFLREGLERARATRKRRPPLPRSRNMGRELVDVADRDALYDIFDRESGLISEPDPPVARSK